MAPSDVLTAFSERERTAFLGAGSNLGRRRLNLARARKRLEAYGVQTVLSSSLYRTAPVGFKEQPDFCNAVWQVETKLAPSALLATCLKVERELGRLRTVNWGPRVIDLDLLLYEDLILTLPGLEVPHPCLNQRRFVLVPLAEIAAGWRHPASGQSVRRLLLDCADRSPVELWEEPE